MEKKVSALAQPVFLDTIACKGEEREKTVSSFTKRRDQCFSFSKNQSLN